MVDMPCKLIASALYNDSRLSLIEQAKGLSGYVMREWMTAQDMALALHHIESEDAMSIEEIKAKLGLRDDELKALLVSMGFKPKAIKVESAELIARRAE